MISERTLKKWRREALIEVGARFKVAPDADPLFRKLCETVEQLHGRILKLTQELMDLRLMQK